MEARPIASEEVRTRLARESTPAARRLAWISLWLMAPFMTATIYRDVMPLFGLSKPASLLGAVALICLLAVIDVWRLRVRGPEDYSDFEVAEALRSAIQCSKCHQTILRSEWRCPGCGSLRHQLSARGEFVPAVSIPLIVAILYAVFWR